MAITAQEQHFADYLLAEVRKVVREEIQGRPDSAKPLLPAAGMIPATEAPVSEQHTEDGGTPAV